MKDFEKLFMEIEQLLDDPDYKATDDVLGRIRLKVLKAGIQAANQMVQHPELAQPCIQLLISHMEVYADLVTATQNMHINIPGEEEVLASILRLSTTMGES